MPVQLQDDDDLIPVRDDELGVPDGDAGTVYTLRSLTRERYKAIIKAHTKKIPNRQRGMEDVIDWPAVGEDLLDYALVSWVGILWKGQPSECTRERKLRLDPTRATALLDKAGLNQVQAVAEQKAASFRPPA